MKQFEITTTNEGQRFDKYLIRIIGNGGISFIYKMLRKKNFVLNDKKATGKEILKAGDIVKLYISDDTYNKFKSELKEIVDVGNKTGFAINENIIYEDKDIILINKPEGILSQKAKNDDVSINEYLLSYLKENGTIDNDSITDYRPSCVNRLDRNTTGIIIAAKTLKAARVVSDGLKNRTIDKYYKCIVRGKFNKEGLHKGYLVKNSKDNKVLISDSALDNSDYIETEYKILKITDSISVLEVHLLTGKTHQIRAHLSYLGFPIIGDRKYGDSKINKQFKAKNQLLHAYKIVFPDYEDSLELEFSDKTFICEPNFRY
ncbi:MAG: RluA family pseudouridine synthase [Lachnospiraceae bacterium]|nr:RluA family pseudouridine synthase [Lachnospiraceae bacterium]